MNPKREYSSISLSKSTRELLLHYKLKRQAELGRQLTWDEVILELLKTKKEVVQI